VRVLVCVCVCVCVQAGNLVRQAGRRRGRQAGRQALIFRQGVCWVKQLVFGFQHKKYFQFQSKKQPSQPAVME
jgi:hypothetical protein